jgi:hypothetical protein
MPTFGRVAQHVVLCSAGLRPVALTEHVRTLMGTYGQLLQTAGPHQHVCTTIIGAQKLRNPASDVQTDAHLVNKHTRAVAAYLRPIYGEGKVRLQQIIER